MRDSGSITDADQNVDEKSMIQPSSFICEYDEVVGDVVKSQLVQFALRGYHWIKRYIIKDAEMDIACLCYGAVYATPFITGRPLLGAGIFALEMRSSRHCFQSAHSSFLCSIFQRLLSFAGRQASLFSGILVRSMLGG